MKALILAAAVACTPALAVEPDEISSHIQISNFKNFKDGNNYWFQFATRDMHSSFKPVPVPLYMRTDLKNISAVVVFDENSNLCGESKPHVLARTYFDEPVSTKGMSFRIQIPCIVGGVARLSVGIRADGVSYKTIKAIDQKRLSNVLSWMYETETKKPIPESEKK